MKRRIIQPDRVLVIGEYELGNPEILKIYYRVFERGHGEDLPPMIVASPGTEEERGKRLLAELVRIRATDPRSLVYAYDGSTYTTKKGAIEKTEEAYRRLEEKIREIDFYLIDGNHRSAAATLANQQLVCFELETDRDLEDTRKMVSTGQLFGFPHEHTSLKDLVVEAERWSLRNIDDLRTVKERVDQLAVDGFFPGYMRKNMSEASLDEVQ